MKASLRCFLLGLTVLGALPVQAVSAVASPPDLVALQFRLMAWGGDVPELSFGRRQKVALTEANTRSSVQDYTGPATLTFTLAQARPEGEKPAPVVASVLLPRDTKKITLFTVPTGPGRFGMYSIGEDASDLPAGRVRLHNLSTERLLIGYNNHERVELAPAGSVLTPAAEKALVVRVARMVNGRWRELFNNVIELQDGVGSNVLFINGVQGGGLGMFAVPGWPATPPVAPGPDANRAP